VVGTGSAALWGAGAAVPQAAIASARLAARTGKTFFIVYLLGIVSIIDCVVAGDRVAVAADVRNVAAWDGRIREAREVRICGQAPTAASCGYSKEPCCEEAKKRL
jgi:hypothetical protein